MKRILLIATIAACASGGPEPKLVCRTDGDCGAGRVCFPDGCGEPQAGIVVEVSGNNRDGIFPQDFAVGDGGFSATMVFELAGPLTINGTVNIGRGDTIMAYTDALKVRAVGESDLIPGITRTFETSFASLGSNHFYTMTIGAGRYTVTGSGPAVNDVPPAIDDGILVTSPVGATFEAPSVNFTFTDMPLYLQGTVVKTDLLNISSTDRMQLQAIDPATRKVLSQPITIQSNGVFFLHVDASASQLSTVSLVVSPQDSSSLVPTKTFVQSVTGTNNTMLKLELGDYGGVLADVPGSVIGTDGNPISGATVFIGGIVPGDGTFMSQQTTTNADGGFAVNLLESQSDSSFLITVYPPPGSPSGILKQAIGAIPDALGGHLTQATFTCPDRIIVMGKLLHPDGETPSTGASVVANPVDTVAGYTLPRQATKTTTDQDGRYTLYLDPAVYRLDYIPIEALPQKSRVVRVEPTIDADAGAITKVLDIEDFPLSTGRTINGTVTLRAPSDAPGSGKLTPYALVRFFRVTSVEGNPSSLLLGQAVTDTSGSFQVILPDHPATASLVDAGFIDAGVTADAGPPDSGSPDSGQP